MKTVLVIMAAGIGSRFGGGIKQLANICRERYGGYFISSYGFEFFLLVDIIIISKYYCNKIDKNRQAHK